MPSQPVRLCGTYATLIIFTTFALERQQRDYGLVASTIL